MPKQPLTDESPTDPKLWRAFGFAIGAEEIFLFTGLILLGLGVGLRFGVDMALIVLGGALIGLAVFNQIQG